MDEYWRMAFMFDARDGNRAALEDGLKAQNRLIRKLAGDAGVRLGVVDTHPSLLEPASSAYDSVRLRGLDGAVEISVAPTRMADLPALADAVRDMLQELSAPASVEVTTGPVFPMVPVRDGEAFLSLAFKRYPGTTSAAFRDWWRFQHSGIAIPVLGDGLLAYDQVHVDAPATQALADVLGVACTCYDAYDNLTWANREAYLVSLSDSVGMARIFSDEIGRIDNTSRRGALMRIVGSSRTNE